jgi:hypothetical protein
MKNRVEIPTINKKYNFYDDGKVSFGRHSIVEVKRILTIEEAKQLQIKYYETNEIKSLYDIFMIQEAMTFSCGCNLYDPDTDVFLECSIPEYDDDLVYFARTKDGGFFSFDTTGYWMSGQLDVDGSLTKMLYETYGEEPMYMDCIQELILD